MLHQEIIFGRELANAGSIFSINKKVAKQKKSKFEKLVLVGTF